MNMFYSDMREDKGRLSIYIYIYILGKFVQYTFLMRGYFDGAALCRMSCSRYVNHIHDCVDRLMLLARHITND